MMLMASPLRVGGGKGHLLIPQKGRAIGLRYVGRCQSHCYLWSLCAAGRKPDSSSNSGCVSSQSLPPSGVTDPMFPWNGCSLGSAVGLHSQAAPEDPVGHLLPVALRG